MPRCRVCPGSSILVFINISGAPDMCLAVPMKITAIDGYQCTLWNYTAEPGGSSCLSMYDDHKMKACAATVCCSSYTEDFTRAYPGPWDDGGSGPGRIGRGSVID